MKPRLWIVSPRLIGGGTENALQAELPALRENWRLHFVTEYRQGIEAEVNPYDEMSTVRPRGLGQVRFQWWYVAASRIIEQHRQAGERVYSPGINCRGADLITVHISFSDYKLAQQEARRWSPKLSVPRKLNRRLWSRQLTHLEQRIYGDCRVKLTAVSRRLQQQLEIRWKRPGTVYLTPPPVSVPAGKGLLHLAVPAGRKIVLGVGNDWQNKGFWFFLEVLRRIPKVERPLFVVAGSENPGYGFELMERLGVRDDVLWLGRVDDMLGLYRRVDLVVAPSFEDSWSLPVVEALHSGRPVLVSDRVGCAEMLGLKQLAAGDPALWKMAVREQLRVSAPAAHPGSFPEGDSLARIIRDLS